MPVVSRGFLLVLALIVALLAAAAAAASWLGGAWEIGSVDTLRLTTAIDGSREARTVAAAAGVVVAVVILILGVTAAAARRRTVTMWLPGQQSAQVLADVVARFLRTAVEEVAGVEAARVTAESAARGTTAISLDVTMAPEADATRVAAGIEERIGTMLTPSCTIVLGGRPNITIHYAMGRMREGGGNRQAA